MKISVTALLIAFFANSAYAHADAQLHSHGFELGLTLVAIGLVLLAAGIVNWVLLR